MSVLKQFELVYLFSRLQTFSQALLKKDLRPFLAQSPFCQLCLQITYFELVKVMGDDYLTEAKNVVYLEVFQDFLQGVACFNKKKLTVNSFPHFAIS